jgi:hypothetical protein
MFQKYIETPALTPTPPPVGAKILLRRTPAASTPAASAHLPSHTPPHFNTSFVLLRRHLSSSFLFHRPS